MVGNDFELSNELEMHEKIMNFSEIKMEFQSYRERMMNQVNNMKE